MATGADSAPDYLLVGHLCRDVIEGHTRAGGTVLYAGITAARLGKRVAIATAFGDPLPTELEGMDVARLPASNTTVFEHHATPGGRALRLLDRAPAITGADVPEAWRRAPLVHLAPIANEFPPDLASLFPGSRVVATPQGWLGGERTDALPDRAPLGARSVGPLQAAGPALPRFKSMVVSIEDLDGSWDAAAALASGTPVVVVTQGAEGYTLFVQGCGRWYPPFPAREVDATGAGDVFAASFFVRLAETGNAPESARFAAMAAALSVSGQGASRIPTRAEVVAALDGQW